MAPARTSETTADTSAGGPRTRSSSKRDAVLEVLDQSQEFLSAQDIHTELRTRGQKVGLATVYRTLQALTDSGELDVLRSENGESTFRSCSASHHHHLVCRMCGKTVEVKAPSIEKWADSTADKHGFRDVSHTVEIFGVCSAH